MSTNNYNNLIGGIKQVDLINPIDMIQNEPITFFSKDFTKGKMKNETKNKSRCNRMDNFMKPVKSNLSTIEDIKRKIKTGKITFDNTFDEELKVVTIAPGFVYGVDTREYYPKKNVHTGPSISNMAN